MNELEKAEKLRERANVSYEEALEALKSCDGDLLEAMVMLEKQGKVKGPEQSSYSTSYEEQLHYVSVVDSVEESKKNGKSFWERLKNVLDLIWQKGNDNFFCVYHKDEVAFKIPVWVFVVALVLGWEVVLIAMIVALFFDCRYSFVGKDELKSMNEAFNKASEFASQIKDEFEK